MQLRDRDLVLYAVTDRTWLHGRKLAEQVEEALKGGVTMIQLREKDLDEDAFEAEALEIRKICSRYGVPFLINDNVALARKIDADGVHVGQSDMEAANVREILGPDKIIGVTAKTPEQAKAAYQAGADYLGSGAVFGTSTKADAKPMDLELFQEICASVPIPVVAIGGISANNIGKLRGSGMKGVAVVSGIFASKDIERDTRQLRMLAEAALDEALFSYLEKIRLSRPVVHCVSNIVTANVCANALLAIGASPTMAHHPEEMEEFERVSNALVLSMGATENLDAMMLAGKAARMQKHPVILDPVGCGASGFRREKCLKLIREIRPDCIRGNYSEIKALAMGINTARGVDTSEDTDRSDDIRELVRMLSKSTGAVIAATGETDLISDGETMLEIHRGSAMLSRITGAGCMLSALMGAFFSVRSSIESAKAAILLMNLAGEIAENETRGMSGGTGTFHVRLMDAISML